MSHFLQSPQWREVKRKLGNRVFEVGEIYFQTTKLPLLNKYIGYSPRADLGKIDWNLLYSKAKEAGCVYVSVDPSNQKPLSQEAGKSEAGSWKLNSKFRIPNSQFLTGKPTQIQNDIILDISKSETELLANMKPKHRYNIKVGQKHGIQVEISQDKTALETFLKLHEQTVERQKYRDRSSDYIRTVWDVISKKTEGEFSQSRPAEVYVAVAYYNPNLQSPSSNRIPLSSWFIVTYEGTAYYLYGGSSDLHTNVMSTYVMVWEVIKWGQARGLSKIDFMGVEKDLSDGYSRFKAGFGGELVEYEDTVDLVIEPLLYKIVKLLLKFAK